MIGSTLKIVNTNTMASMAEDNRKNNMSSELAIDKLMIGSSPVIFLTFLVEFVIVTERRDRNSGTFYFIVVQSEI